MNETADPLAALGGKSIAQRAAGARDLSQMGEVGHLELLAAVAGSDRSPGVRLSAAAAAADILSRHRIGDAVKKIGPKKRRTLAALYRRIDPSVNPGVFSVFGCLDTPAAFEAICGGLRDPRGDIRLGAAVGLLRMATSGALAGASRREKQVVRLLADARHKPDALAEIAKICAAVDYRTGEDAVRALSLSGAHGELVAEALMTFEANAAPLSGLWFSDGRDAGETNPGSPLGAGLALLGAGGARVCIDGKWKTDKSFPGEGLRRMHFRRVGAAQAAPAFQAAGRTWYLAAGPSLLCVIDGLTSPRELDWDNLGKPNATAGRAVAAVSAHLPETAGGDRARALLLVRTGDVQGAIAALQASLEQKKPFPDTWCLLGDALWSAGKKKAARAHYTSFIKKARKRDFPEAYERAKSRAG